MTEGKWVTPQGLRSNEQLGYSTRHEPEYEYAIKGTTRKLREAEAAIARVREFLADKDEGLTDDARAQGHFILVDTDSVRRALEGDSDG